MPIDHTEAMKRTREYFTFQGKPYIGEMEMERIAGLIQTAVRETALECSEICRRHADRAPGGLVPVGVGARASDEIRFQFGLTGKPYEALPPESGASDAPFGRQERQRSPRGRGHARYGFSEERLSRQYAGD